MARGPWLGHLRVYVSEWAFLVYRYSHVYASDTRAPSRLCTHTYTLQTHITCIHVYAYAVQPVIIFWYNSSYGGRPPRAAGVVGGPSRSRVVSGGWGSWRYGVVEAAWSVQARTHRAPWNDKAAITGWVRSREPIRERSQGPVGQSGRAFHPSFVSKFARATGTQYNETRDGKRGW